MIKVGSKIADINYEVADGENLLDFEIFHNNDITKTSFSKYEGKWLVLFFYPADFTFICPTELEAFADKYEDFKKLGAEVISMSKDTAFVHKAWHKENKGISKIKYPMGSDFKSNITRTFNVGEDEMNEGLPLRATFIIDPSGVVKSMEVNDNSIGRNVNETFRKLQAAIFTSKHKGEVCPVNWSPEKKSLKLPDLTILK